MMSPLRRRLRALRERIRPVRGWRRYRPAPIAPDGEDIAARDRFLDSSISAEERFTGLFGYFLEGYLRVVTPGRERAQYRGMGSTNGYLISGVEGFARTVPMFAAWLAAGRPAMVTAGGGAVDLAQLIAAGLRTGSDPQDPAFWGNPATDDQLIVEAADIALAVWLGRDSVWPLLSATEQARLVAWLRSAMLPLRRKPTNWALFPVLIEAVLAALAGRTMTASPALEAYKAHEAGHGWFFDHPGRIDFYNVWGSGYSLFWIHRIQPSLDPGFLRRATADNADLTAHLISPRGVPIMGRSVCYRAASAAPLVAQSLLLDDAPFHGMARRALEVTCRRFVGAGMLKDGTMTQGWAGDDRRLLDHYSGPGSSHWGLRALILALLHPPGSAFWTVAEQPLPVERSDYRIALERAGWTITGNQASGDIHIRIAANAGRHPRIRRSRPGTRLAEVLFRRPFRSGSAAARYGAETYSVLDPYPER